MFVNFGDVKDHMWLAEHMIPVGGKICIAKYGATFRGEKVFEFHYLFFFIRKLVIILVLDFLKILDRC